MVSAMAREDRPTGRARATAAARAGVAGAGLLIAACGAPAGPDAPPGGAAVDVAASPESILYDVALDLAGSLDVTARFPAGTTDRMHVEAGAEPFVIALTPPAQHPPGRGEPFVVACAGGCELRYRFDLAGAAAAFDHAGYAARAGGAWLAPPSTWLLHPRDGDLSRRFELRVTTPPGQRFATGLPPLPDDGVVHGGTAAGEPGGRRARAVFAALADLPSAPYSALGAMESHPIDVAGGAVVVVLVGHPAGDRAPILVDWVREAARDVAGLLGAPAAPHAAVVVEVRPGDDLSFLTALGNGGASVHAPVGVDVAPGALARDWRMTHEWVHLGSPGLHRRHAWFSEGLATYLEPIARAWRGRLPEERVWQDLAASLPLGQPGPGDEGLDRTPTWGRTYWGGALFCLVADVEARRRTGGARSLVDAVRAIHRAGGDVRQRWSMLRTLEVGDAAIGSPVLGELYAAHRHRAVAVDLEALWRELGVVPRPDGSVELDDGAPLAAIRRAITAPPPR